MLTFILDIIEAYWLAKRLENSWLIFLLCVPLAGINSLIGNSIMVLVWRLLEVSYTPAEVTSRIVVGSLFYHPAFILIVFFINKRRFKKRNLSQTES